ncbi:hypothetical protein [Cupriavidus sp. TMH.W2]
MTNKEQKELARLGRLWATGQATMAQMLRHAELARKDAASRGAAASDR